MGFSEHQDNLSLNHLELQERKDVIEKKLLKEIKTEEMKTYGEILKTLRPDQI